MGAAPDPGGGMSRSAGSTAVSVPAVDDVVATWHDVEGSSREPLLVLEPLLAYLRERGIADGWPRVKLIGDGLSNATFALSLTMGLNSCCGGLLAVRFLLQPTMSCARRTSSPGSRTATFPSPP